jgi:hypothetical protein
MSVQQNEQQGVLVQKENWHLRGQTAATLRFIWTSALSCPHPEVFLLRREDSSALTSDGSVSAVVVELP